MYSEATKKTRIIWFVIISIVMIALAILVYYVQNGQLKLSADIIMPTTFDQLSPVYRENSDITGQHFYTMNNVEMQRAQREDNLTYEGNAWYSYPYDTGAVAPDGMSVIYRQSNTEHGDHFYTMDEEEAKKSLAENNYISEGYLGYAFPYVEGQDAPLGTSPIFRGWNPEKNNHFYTADKEEFDNAVANDGYEDEGILGYAYVNTVNGVSPVYREVEDTAGMQHFYTMNNTEMQKAQREDGLVFEGNAWYSYPYDTEAIIPSSAAVIYRQWNPSTGDHFYTMDKEEADNSIAIHDYVDEDYLGYAYPYEDGWDAPFGTVPIYRGWNPNEQYHFYTTNREEFENAVANDGYNDEGILGYAYDEMVASFFVEDNPVPPPTPVPTPNSTLTPTTSPVPVSITVVELVSTGASFWFNMLIALLIIVGLGYWMFRGEIWKNK